EGADAGIEEGPVRSRQRHRNQHGVGRHWKERTFHERDRAHQPGRMGLPGGGDAPIVKAAKHGGPAYRPTRRLAMRHAYLEWPRTGRPSEPIARSLKNALDPLLDRKFHAQNRSKMRVRWPIV